MPWEWPFLWRVFALLAFLLGASAVERLIRGPGAVRLGETLFLVACGAAGAALGLLVDLCTSTLSPDYFAIGKGLGREPGLSGRALALGLEAGTGAGVVVGCLLLAANTVGRGAPRQPVRELYARLPAVLAWSVSCGVVGAGVGGVMPAAVLGDWRQVVELDAHRAFLLVWVAHTGLYLGGAVGAIWVIRRTRGRAPDRA